MLNLFQIEISLGGEALAHAIDLTSQRFIETPVAKTGQISCHALLGDRFTWFVDEDLKMLQPQNTNFCWFGCRFW